MEPARTPAMSTLQSLIFLGRVEEKRLRTILEGKPDFKLRMQTQFDLEKILRKTKVQSEELEKLRSGEA